MVTNVSASAAIDHDGPREPIHFIGPGYSNIA